MAGQGWINLSVDGMAVHSMSQQDKCYCQVMTLQGHACLLIAGRPWPNLSGRTWTGLPDPACSAPQDERMTWFGPVHEKRKAYLILASLHQYV